MDLQPDAPANGVPLRLVAVHDRAETGALVETALTHPDLDVHTAASHQEGLALVRHLHPAIVLIDLVSLVHGMDLLDRILEIDPGVQVLLLAADSSTDAAVEAIRRGASDYLSKPVTAGALRERVEKLLEEAGARRRTLELDERLLETCRFEGMIGRSPLMLEVFARIRRVAPHFSTVLVSGPTGSGKELAARALHRLSPAASGPFVACNCSAIVDTLFESELFGYMRGAFTGATQDKIGMIEYAQGGTLLLDEIGEMPLGAQAKLLRVLQNREVQRVGSPAVRHVDLRVIAVTNRDLAELVARKQFREDLYYRISMVRIDLPALVERREDLPLLQRHFLDTFSAQYGRAFRGLSRRAQALLGRHHWPGNVRELENALGCACMLADKDFLDVPDLPGHLRRQAGAGSLQDEELLPLEEVERRHARRVLARMGGNRVRAAEVLGISRATLYRLLAAAPAQRSRELASA